VEGPFRQVDQSIFANVLRAIGGQEVGLVEQASDGLLLLAQKGEWLVEHYSFFAVFNTKEEFRVICDGKELGVLPIDSVVTKGATLIFSGRRWHVLEVHEKEKVILVKPARQGVVPIFGGDPGVVHDNVVTRMLSVLEGEVIPVYMDPVATELLSEARSHYRDMRLMERSIVSFEMDKYIVATRRGTVKTSTLALALRGHGFRTEAYDGFLVVEADENVNSLEITLKNIATDSSVSVFANEMNLEFEKYHPYLTEELLQKDALSSRLDVDSLRPLCRELLKIV
jgi:ATP-dependent Lhr-like helicase